jgi:tetratricopeptide (TPR) repeat protein
VTVQDRPYRTRELAHILDLPPRRLRAWAHAGLLHPERGGRGHFLFGFRDAVAARTIARLLSDGAGLPQIRESVTALRGRHPGLAIPLAEVRFRFEGGRVLFQDGGALVAPSGELTFDFEAPAPEEASPRARAELHFAQGYGAAWERNDLPTAEAAFREAVAIDPTFADAWCDLGTVVLRQGEAREARRLYLRALEAQPNHAEALCNLARLLLQEGLADLAADCLRRALAVAPEFALAHLHAGIAYERLGDLRRAVDHLTRALALEPNSDWAVDAQRAVKRLLEQLGPA